MTLIYILFNRLYPGFSSSLVVNPPGSSSCSREDMRSMYTVSPVPPLRPLSVDVSAGCDSGVW